MLVLEGADEFRGPTRYSLDNKEDAAHEVFSH